MKILHIGNYYPREKVDTKLFHLVSALQVTSDSEHRVIAINSRGSRHMNLPVVGQINISANNRAFSQIAKTLPEGKLGEQDVVHVYIDANFNGGFDNVPTLYSPHMQIKIATTITDLDKLSNKDLETLDEIVERSKAVVVNKKSDGDYVRQTISDDNGKVHISPLYDLSFYGFTQNEARKVIWNSRALSYNRLFHKIVTTYW